LAPHACPFVTGVAAVALVRLDPAELVFFPGIARRPRK
jgi:hypothetical protein